MPNTKDKSSSITPVAYTHDDFARLFSISPNMVRKMVAAGHLAQLKLGKSARIPHAEVIRLLGEKARK